MTEETLKAASSGGPITPGGALRNVLAARDVTAFTGIYDALSATVAGRHSDTLFVSGYGYAASHYGLPDVGFIAWTDMLALVARLRGLLPRHHLLVDLDDGYGDPEIAAHVAAAMERAGASGIILEDQQRPRRCGHAPGKQVLPLEQYLEKLGRVLAARKDLFVVARTDASDDDERVRRAIAFADAGADAVLADGIADLGVLMRIARAVRVPVMFNQIAGGKSPTCTLTELRAAGVSMVNYSTPCLFAAIDAMERSLETLRANDGLLRAPGEAQSLGVADVTAMLTRNLTGAAAPVVAAVVAPLADLDARVARLSPAKQRLLAARSKRIEPAPAHDATAPLSRTQHWFWSATQLDPNLLALNTTRCFRLVGALDVNRLQLALRSVIARHAILRTTYELPSGGDAPRQRVREVPPAIGLPIVDLADVTPIEQDDAVGRAIDADARVPFNLAAGPIWRARLARLSSDEHVLLFTVHHIAFDGWSVGVFQRDLADAYSTPDATIAPLAMQYADYARWQRAAETADASRVDDEYWSRQLAGLRPPALPTDRPRSRATPSRGARHVLALPPDLLDAARRLARSNDATLYVTLLAGFEVLLHEWIGSDDLAIGAHLAQRERVECEAMIGPFVNTLVLRTRLDVGMTFAGLLARVRATTLDAMRHAGMPYDRLVRVADARREPGRNPLYDVSFQLRNFPKAGASRDAAGLRIERLDRGNGIARCDLDVLADESDAGLSVAFDYDADLFDAATIERLADRYAATLRAVTANPLTVIADARSTIATPAVATRAATLPLTPTQARLAALWAGVLDVKTFGADDDFFAVGGHSLRAVVCAARIREAFGIELPVVAFFQTPTLAGLAAQIDAAAIADDGAMKPQPIAPRSPQLSPAQQRLWFLDRYESSATTYNVTVGRRLRGPLDPSRLQRAIGAVVRRHEILRTRYPDVDGIPAIAVTPADAASPTLAIIDAVAVDRDEAIAAAIRVSAGERFDLAAQPSFRARLLRFDANDHALLITMHHIVCDEWSIRVLMEELSAAYAADSGDALPAMRSQYVDFAARQHDWLASDAPAAEADYWVRHLAGAPAALALPTDRPRSAARTSRGARVPLVLEPTIVARLQAIGRREQATDFMTTLALFTLLLTRWSRQRAVVVGTPVANRDRPEDHALIGYLLNTLPLRVQIPESGTFRELLARVRESVVGGIAHQRLPFERIIEAVRPPRNLDHSPLFQVMFVLRTEGDGRLALPGIEGTPIDGYNHGAKFDLSLLLGQSAGRIDGILEFNTDLFDAESIQALAARYVALAGAVANDGDATIDALCEPDDAERRLILDTFNRPTPATGGTIVDLWREQARRTPDAPAVVFGDRMMTYAQLDERSDALARELARRGVTNEARVGLYLRRSIDAMAALLGALKSGAAYVPLDPTYPAARLTTMLDDAAIRLVLTESALAGDALLAGRTTIELDRAWPGASTTPLPAIAPDALAYVLYTSGSTGKPKGVAVPHGPAWHLARWQREHSACAAGTRTLQFTSLNFDVSFQEIFSTWCAGGTLVLVDDLTRRDPDALLRHIVEQRVDRLFLPFVALQGLADAACKSGAPRAGLREVMTAGEQLRMTPTIARWFTSMPGCTLTNQYGPTETHVINTSLPLAGAPATWPALPAIGRPIDGSRLYVLDARRALLPVGTPGELYIAGACLARGYLGRNDLTAAAFVRDPFVADAGARMYRTGDLARWNHDGTIQHLGRADAQVKVQGYRVEPGEIEDALSRFPGIRQAAVVARDDPNGGKRLVAYVVADAAPDARALRRFLATTLPAYMVPAAFVPLAAMPLTSSNKIDRAALPAAGAAIEEGDGGQIPTNDVERALVEIWRDVLGRAHVGVRDSFFDLGGQSLLAVHLFARIERRFGRALPLSALFSSPTIAQLAPLLAELPAPTGSTPPRGGEGVVIPLQPHGERPPLFCLAGINGHVFSYLRLAGLLGATQPVYGLQVEGLESDREAMNRVEEIAAFLIRHVRLVQPRGPYALLGYSFGGTVAYEMAQQLRAAGERVTLLGMLDTFALALPRKSWPSRVAIHARRVVTTGPREACRYLAQRLAGRVAPNAAPIAPPVGDDDDVDSISRAVRRVRQASEVALRRYEPRAYDGVVTLFRARSRPAWHEFVVERPLHGWDALARGVEVYSIDGTHLTMFEGDGARSIAAVLRDRLADAR